MGGQPVAITWSSSPQRRSVRPPRSRHTRWSSPSSPARRVAVTMPRPAVGGSGSPLFRCWFCAGGVGGGLRPAAQAELGQDVADVVLDGLAAAEQALGDLEIGQPVADEIEHLGFAPGQQPPTPPARRGAEVLDLI